MAYTFKALRNISVIFGLVGVPLSIYQAKEKMSAETKRRKKDSVEQKILISKVRLMPIT